MTQEERVGRGLNRTYYYQQQHHNLDSKMTNFKMQIGFCRESCSDSGDSGVCIDSASEHSQPSPKFLPTSNSYPDWRAVPNFQNSQSTSALKIRRGDQCLSKRHDKPLKVTFADSQDQFTSKTVCSSPAPSPPPLPPPPTLKYYYVVHDSNAKSNGTSTKFPYPPPYDVALDRIQQINKDCSSTKRSASLVRDYLCRPTQDYPSGVTKANTIRPQNYSPSKPTKHSSEPNFSTFPRNSSNKQRSASVSSHRHPGIMPAGSCDGIDHLETIDLPYKNQSTKPKFALCVTSALQKFANHALNKLGSQEKIIVSSENAEIDIPVINCKEGARSPGVCDPLPENVRARLMGIDNKGVHVIELQKLSEGPFGFYISTGTYKRKKGVYVSRLTVRNLHNFLKVGDQILQIDNVSVKGKTLEQIQMMMMDKDKVLLKILPLIS